MARRQAVVPVVIGDPSRSRRELVEESPSSVGDGRPRDMVRDVDESRAVESDCDGGDDDGGHRLDRRSGERDAPVVALPLLQHRDDLSAYLHRIGSHARIDRQIYRVASAEAELASP